MSINFPDLKEVIKIYERKGLKSPLLRKKEVERSEDRVSISEEARRKLAEIQSREGE